MSRPDRGPSARPCPGLLVLPPTICLQPTHVTCPLPSSILCPPLLMISASFVLMSATAALFRAQPSYSSLVSYWCTLLLCDRQWEMMSWLASSLLLYTVLHHATCSACCRPDAAFLLNLILNPEDRREIFPLKSGKFYRTTRRHISEIQLFIATVAENLKSNTQR